MRLSAIQIRTFSPYQCNNEAHKRLLRRHTVWLLSLLSCLLVTQSADAQVLRVYNLDASAYPTISVEFDYYANDGTPLPVDRADILVREFTEQRTITGFECPPEQTPKALSTVLMVDASRSMERDGNLELAQDAARAWIDAQPLGPGEIALGTFSQSNNILRDFTSNRDDLLAGVNEIQTLQGTDFDAAFITPPGGATLLAQNGSQKRVIVLITDGDAEGNSATIIAAAQAAQATVYCVAIGINIPPILFDIADATGGAVFENITSRAAAERTFVRILRDAQEVELCKLSWLSEAQCESTVEVLVSIPTRGAVEFAEYQPPASAIPQLAVTPARLDFGPVAPPLSAQQQVEIRAVAAAIDVSSVNDFHPDYTVTDWGGTPPPFRLEDGESRLLTIEFRPADSSYSGHEFPIETEGACNVPGITVFGGFPGIKPKVPTLKVEAPNGGELFPAGETITVSWSGVPRRDLLRLELSTDGGTEWSRISETATGLETEFRLPRTISNDCLVRLSQGAVPEDSVDGWSWARRGGGATSFTEEARDICLDSSGNIYAVGSFFGALDFGELLLDSRGASDVFLTKFDRDGQLIWVRVFGSTDGDEGMSVACDADGNVYVAGEMRESTTINGETFESAGGRDVFLAKFDGSGIAQWIRNAGGERSDDFGEMTVTADGRIYICGNIVGRADFEDETIGLDGSGAIFVAQYSTDGALNWVNANQGNFSFRACCLAMNTDQELLLLGTLIEDENIDGIALSSSSTSDIFMARLDPADGRARSAIVLGQNGNEFSQAVTLDGDGNATIVGNFDGTLDLGDGAISSRGNSDFFVAQFSPANQLNWSLYGGGSEEDGADDILAGADGTLYMLAHAKDNFSLGTQSFAADDRDIVVAQLSQAGDINWLRLGGETFSQRARALVFDDNDHLYFAAEFVLSAQIGINNLRARGNGDAMIAAMRVNLDVTQSDVSDNTWSIVAPQYVAQQIDMGVVPLGSRRDSLVTDWLNNVAPLPMIIDDITIEGVARDDFRLISVVPERLEDGAALDIEIVFEPRALGLRQAVLLVTTAGGEQRFDLTGNAVAEKLRTIVEDDIVDFGAVALGRSLTFRDRFLVSRISASPVTLDAIVLEQNGTQFSIPALQFPMEVPIDGGVSLDLTFTPDRRGRSNAELLLYCNGLATPLRIPMTGIGLEDVIFIPDLSGAAGENVNLELRLGRPLTAVQAQLFNRFAVTIGVPGDVLIPDDGRGAVTNGERSLTLEGLVSEGMQQLASIPMAVALGANERSPLRILEVEWFNADDELVDPGFATGDGEFLLTGFCEVGGQRLFNNSGRAAAINMPQPNPAIHSVVIPLQLIEVGRNSLQIFSLRGELYHEQVFEVTAAGSFELNFDCSFLPNGRYIILVSTPTQTLEQQLEVRR